MLYIKYGIAVTGDENHVRYFFNSKCHVDFSLDFFALLSYNQGGRVRLLAHLVWVIVSGVLAEAAHFYGFGKNCLVVGN